MPVKPRIAVVVSHPIQHFCPQYVSFAANNDAAFKVFFASALGYKKYLDQNFKQEIFWGNLQLDKFQHQFLNGEAIIQSDKNIDAANLDSELAIYKPDLIIIYGYFQKLQRRAHRWANKNNVLVAYISDTEMRHKRSWIKEMIKSVFLKRYFSKINYFLSVGDANEAFYKKHGVGNEQIVRMHFPIDISQYEKSYSARTLLRKNIRDEHAISENEFVLSVVGKLAPWKNQDHIIEALQLLEKDGILVHLFVLGSGEMMEVWQEKAARLLQTSKVYFKGFVNIEKLPAYYAASDIYVHPASVEPHSIAISEAIFMGCPIILSDRCGSYGDSDDVQVDKNGDVFEFGNIPELAGKIKALLLNENKRIMMGNYSHSLAAQFQQKAHYSIVNELVKRINHRKPVSA